jgi:hypothetical protein
MLVQQDLLLHLQEDLGTNTSEVEIFICKEESQLCPSFCNVTQDSVTITKNLELSMSQLGCISCGPNNFSSFTISPNPLMANMSLQVLEFF